MAIVNIPGVGLVDKVTGKKVVKNPVTNQTNTTKIATNVTQNAVPKKVVTPTKKNNGATTKVVTTNSSNNKVVVSKVPTKVNDAATKKTTVTPTGKTYTNDAYGYINQTYDAQKKQALVELGQARDKSLASLEEERKKVEPIYYEKRRQETAVNGQQSKSFAEYLAARGLSNSGFAAQSEINRGSKYQSGLNELDKQQNQVYDNINKQVADVNTTYNNNLQEQNFKLDQSRNDSIFKQKQTDAKAKADAAAAKAKADAAAALAVAKMNNATKNAQIRANATLSAAQIKANTAAQKKLDTENAATQKKLDAAKKPSYTDGIIKSTFNITVDATDKTVSVNEKDKPGVGKVILTSTMTPQEQYNMLKKYGITKLGPINSKRYVTNVLSSSMSPKEKQGYLAKFGIKTQQDVDRILKGK